MRTIKAIFWSVRTLVLIVPLIVIGIWSFAYIRLCLITLASPGKPIEFRYKAPAGYVTIRADSYIASLRGGTVSLVGPRIIDPNGHTVIQARYVALSGLDLKRGSDQRLELLIDHLSGRLVRTTTGKFQFVELLPPTSPKPSKVPFHVIVKQADIVLEDRDGSVWQQAASVPLVEVSGAGQDWVAHGSGTLSGMGTAEASIQNVPGVGVHVSGSTTGMQGERLLAHVLKTDEAKPLGQLTTLQVSRVTASGPFRVFVPANRRAAIEVRANVDASDLSWQHYRIDHLKFAGFVTSKGAQGTATARLGGSVAEFRGSGSWFNGRSAAGQVDVRSPSWASLPAWVRSQVPAGVNFSDGRYTGWVSYAAGRPVAFQGSASARSASFKKISGHALQAAVSGTASQVRAEWRQGTVMGSEGHGTLDIDLKADTVNGFIEGESHDLASLASLVNVHGLSGKGFVQAIVGGTVRSPAVQFVATGNAQYALSSRSVVGPESVDLVGTYQKGAVLIDRGLIAGRTGTLGITGHGQANGSAISMHIDGRDLKADDLVTGVTGDLDVDADVSGSFTDPKFTGRLEGTDISYRGHTVAATSVDFVGNRTDLFATNVAAVSGTMDLTGSARYDLKSGDLAGLFSVSGVQSNEFLGDQYAGIINAPDIRLAGTVRKPTVTAVVQSKELVAQDVVVEALQGTVSASISGVQVDHATAMVAGGQLEGSGQYSWKTKSGTATASATAIDLAKLAATLGQRIEVTGTASIETASATFHGTDVQGKAKGRLSKVEINGAATGDGNWTFAKQGADLHGELSIGELIPEVRVLDFAADYNLDSRTIKGSIDSDHVRIQNIVASAKRYLPGSWTADPTNIDSISGDLTVGVKIDGPVRNPDLTISSLLAEKLTYRSEKLGDLSSTGTTRVSEKWTIPDLSLKGPQGTVSVKGSLDEHGPIAMTAEGKDILLAGLAPIVPSMGTNPGTANFKMVASGETRRPSITGSGRVDHVLKPSADLAQPGKVLDDLAIKIPKIAVNDSSIAVDGTYTFAGFNGTFGAVVPFSYEDGIGHSNATGLLTLEERKLGELPLLNSYFDPARTSGTFGGSITASGPYDALKFSGGLSLNAKTLGVLFPGNGSYVKKIDDLLSNVTATLHLTPQRMIAFDTKGNLQRGGDFALSAAVPLPSLEAALQGETQGLLQSFQEEPLTGKLSLNNAKLRQGAPGGYVAGQINGSVDLGGTITKPAIGTQEHPGNFAISQLDTVMPALPAGAVGGGEASIDPSFNITASLTTNARVRSATADLTLNGGGSMRGTLSDPRATANLVVQKGTILLPGGTVRLDQGGTVGFRFRHPFGDVPTASLDVDLAGRTAVTAIRYGQNSQRYNISLNIRGDLLKSDSLTMEANSDPPGLSSEEALALLGEGGLGSLTSTSGDLGEAQRRVTEALAGFAIPNVLNPVTAPLARSLGLDYLSLEYNAYDQTTFSAARSFSPEFSLQYRGQIGEPTPGLKPIQDFRLVYSPARLPGALRHFSLSVGSDQDSPWKIALEYGLRFGQASSGSTRAKHPLFAPDRNARPAEPSKKPVAAGG